MKAYKIELLIIDHDDVGMQNIEYMLQNSDYFPNRCLSPEVKSIVERDIGPWSDNHPLNLVKSAQKFYKRIFK